MVVVSNPADVVAEQEQGVAADDMINDTILPTRDEVLACQFSSWYPLFAALPRKYRGRSNVTIKSVILDLPEQFVDYLDSDRLILPLGTRTSCALLEHHRLRAGDETKPDWSSDDDDEDKDHDTRTSEENDDDEDENDHHDKEPQFAFPELDQAIEDALSTLGGEAFTPKLNWSSPRDAIWVNAGTLECRTAGDVYLLLKASDFCAHDVHHAWQDVMTEPQQQQQRCRSTDSLTGGPQQGEQQGEQQQRRKPPCQREEINTRPNLQLALRKWCTLYPSQEFRCFVNHRRLLAISQRHHSQHWPHLVERQDEIGQLLQHFYEHVVRDIILVNHQNLERYVMDVYVDQKRRVWLMDVNVWASRTDALLFDWNELTRLAALAAAAADNSNNNNDAAPLPLMRVVETAKQVRVDPLASYRAPIDTLHLASNNNCGSNGAGEDARFRDFMSMCHRPGSTNAESGSSSSDDEGDSD